MDRVITSFPVTLVPEARLSIMNVLIHCRSRDVSLGARLATEKLTFLLY
jgi:hypothetical protein